MIFEALKLIKDELAHYIEVKNTGVNNITADSVVLDNVANVEGNNRPDLQGKIIISLVNIEEESTLKNNLNIQRIPNGRLRHENPRVYLNLYLLFCANFSEEADAYELALQQLSLVVQFIQGNNIFTINNSPNSTLDAEEDPSLSELRIMLDLYTLTFEQINHLWGSLGGKQIPFAMYKCRLVEVRDRRVQKSGESITEIHSSEQIN